jgi:predicted kinase
MLYDNIKIKEVDGIILHVEENSKRIDTIVDEIIKPYSKDLDKYVKFVSDLLHDGENPPTTDELEDFCMNLSTDIYFAGGMCEQLGIRDDISKAVWKEMYNTSRNDVGKGTIADKDAQAELSSQQEQLTNICYNRAYKIMKAKVDAAQELLSSCKKVLSHRMQEEELTRIQSGTGNPVSYKDR